MEAVRRPSLYETGLSPGKETRLHGLTFGRNLAQRPFDEAPAMTKRVQVEILSGYGA